jgi:hypothetical protein
MARIQYVTENTPTVTKPRYETPSVTKPKDRHGAATEVPRRAGGAGRVADRGRGGRPPSGAVAMSDAERMRKYRARRRGAVAAS